VSRRGTGGLYLRGATWWIRYAHRGKEFRESSGSESETVARRLLTARVRETGKRGAKFLGPAEERLRFEDLAKMIRADYAANDRRSGRRLEGSLKHLLAGFGIDRAVDVTADRIVGYAAQRREQGAANATINRELAALKRAFKIAVDAERLSRAPHIGMLEERNTRQGFVEHAEFTALQRALPEHLKDPITFLYLTAWRRSEACQLEWRDVDFDGKVVRLRPEISKNEDGRMLPLTGEIADIITRAHSKRRLDCPYVFHRNGKPILDFRGAWAAACESAGLGKLLVHDLRRSAIRNLVRAGVPDVVAMRLSGHKTRSVFDRYNVIGEEDLAHAVERRDQYLGSRPTKRTVIPITRERR
jgi:integrase